MNEENKIWSFPLKECFGIPIMPHPGAFKAIRRGNHIHTGIDLYTKKDSDIFAVEDGIIVSIEPFTGPKDNSPWWNNTDAILIEGESGVVCYGELEPSSDLKVGDRINHGQKIGTIQRVILEGKERYEITGWSPYMLHMELYPHGKNKASTSYESAKGYLQDPTLKLLSAKKDIAIKTLTWESSE